MAEDMPPAGDRLFGLTVPNSAQTGRHANQRPPDARRVLTAQDVITNGAIAEVAVSGPPGQGVRGFRSGRTPVSPATSDASALRARSSELS